MADRTNDRYFSDSFGRDDSSTVGNNWATDGALQILNQTLRQSGASSAAAASALISAATAAPECGDDYEAGIVVACDNDSSSRSATVLLRLDGAVASGDGYGVTLTWASDVLTLKIRKLTGGTWATLDSVDVSSEANTASSSYDSVNQILVGRIYDKDGDVLIEALFNDEEKPRLSYTDRSYPLWKRSGTTGIYFEDNDAGVGGHVFVSQFSLLSTAEIDETHLPVVALYSFGKAKKIVRERSLRDSSSSMSDAIFGDYLNEALKELAAKVPDAWWWKETYQFQVKASQTELMLPAKYRLCDDFAYDTGNNVPRPIIAERDYRAKYHGQSITLVGAVQGFRLEGRSPRGGILLKPYPTPSAAATFQMSCWRAPLVLDADTDIPDIPEELQPGWIWAAVSYYTLKDSDRTHAVLSDNKKKEWFADAVRLRNRFQTHTAPQASRSAFRLAYATDRIFGRYR